MKTYFKILLTISFVIGIYSLLHAQPGSGGFGDEPTDAPIDGGLSLLVGAGVAYGAKKLRDRKKNQEKESNN